MGTQGGEAASDRGTDRPATRGIGQKICRWVRGCGRRGRPAAHPPGELVEAGWARLTVGTNGAASSSTRRRTARSSRVHWGRPSGSRAMPGDGHLRPAGRGKLAISLTGHSGAARWAAGPRLGSDHRNQRASGWVVRGPLPGGDLRKKLLAELRRGLDQSANDVVLRFLRGRQSKIVLALEQNAATAMAVSTRNRLGQQRGE